MSRTASRQPRYENIGELLEQLGDIPPKRVCYDPFPGTATKRDLLRLRAKRGRLYELVNRTLVEKPMGFPESHLAMELGYHLRQFLEERDLGFLTGADGMVELLPNLIRGPDVCFIPWHKRPERTVPPDQISKLIPELAVEVLSPSNTPGEIRLKLKEYFLAGVELAWVIDPAKRSADTYTAPDVSKHLDESGTLDGAGVLPGFRLPLAKLFERLEKPKGKKPRKTK
jgi:Uma2 family endonuclease